MWGLVYFNGSRISEIADKKTANYEGHLYCFFGTHHRSLIVYIMNWENFRKCSICLSRLFPSPFPHFSAFQKFGKIFFRSHFKLNQARLSSEACRPVVLNRWVPPKCSAFGQNLYYSFGNRGDFCCNLQNRAFFSVFFNTKAFANLFSLFKCAPSHKRLKTTVVYTYQIFEPKNSDLQKCKLVVKRNPKITISLLLQCPPLNGITDNWISRLL